MSRSDHHVSYDFSFRDVIRVLQILDETPFQELNLELGDVRVRVVRDSTPASAPAAAAPAEQRLAPAEQHLAPAEQHLDPEGDRLPDTVQESAEDKSAGRATAELRPGTVPVHAPMAGVFYRAPAPGARPFVEVGDKVNADDPVGIIEVMKLMHHIPSPCTGVVVDIRAQNEQFVEYNEVLLVIQPD